MAVVILLLFSCASPPAEPEAEPVQEPMAAGMSDVALAELVDPEAEFSPLRYFDTDLITLNDRCPVRKVGLNPKIRAVMVNGRPIGFC